MKPKNVIVYGIMNMWKRMEIESFLDDSYQIIAYSDSNFDFEYFANYPFVAPDRISTLDFSYIIVACESKKVYREIEEKLIGLNIPREKIVWPYLFTRDSIWAYRNLIDDFRRSPLKFEGLIFGNSCALKDINPSYLKKCFYNAGWHGCDLYYCNKLLKKIAEEEKERLKQIKYTILCFPYYLFNYDMSLQVNQLENKQIWTLSHISLKDEHHLNQLKEYNFYLNLFKMNKELFQKNINKHSLSAWEGRDNLHMNSEDNCKNELMTRIWLNKLWVNMHTETIEENKVIFHEFLETLLTNHIQPILFVPPYHKKYQKQSSISKMKEKFYEIVNQEVYSSEIKIFDFFWHDIGDEDIYWADEMHLNSDGAAVFTKYIQNICASFAGPPLP